MFVRQRCASCCRGSAPNQATDWPAALQHERRPGVRPLRRGVEFDRLEHLLDDMALRADREPSENRLPAAEGRLTGLAVTASGKCSRVRPRRARCLTQPDRLNQAPPGDRRDGRLCWHPGHPVRGCGGAPLADADRAVHRTTPIACCRRGAASGATFVHRGRP